VTRHVVVVGGGISGLAAAWDLTGGPAGPDATSPQVTVLEASDRLGGVLCSREIGGRVVDLGPDGFLGRRPEALELCHEMGLREDLVPVSARGAGVWARGRVRPLPEGLALGIPTRLWPTVRSGVLGARGALALAGDAVLPRPDVRGPIADRAIGPLVARKLGQRVVDCLVDPLIGGIHAGSVDDMSAAAVYPPLLAAAQRRGGLMRALRAEVPAPQADPPPLFWAVDGGLAHVVERLETLLRERGADIRTSTPASSLSRDGARWSLDVGGGAMACDAVVIAVPAPSAANLLRTVDDDAAGLLDAIDYASVLLVTFRLSPETIAPPLQGTGFLVPRRSPHPDDPEGFAVTACTYLDTKWSHLKRDQDVLLRVSMGRHGDHRALEWSDDEVTARAWGDLGLLMGVSGTPIESIVTRFPDAFPQYRLHHLLRAGGVESAVARLGGVAVAGSAYRGVGIPACIASGRAAARAVR
jgi:oxygen-dependent protoporphyrinogen oxidase